MYKDKKPQSRKSFTLAEMLITLTIVSVVAIVTLPSLFYQIDDFKWNSSRQKMVYNIREAARRMSFQNAGGTGGLGTAANFRDELTKYLSAAKSCNTVTNCFPATIKDITGNTITTPTNGTDLEITAGASSGLLLNNGAGLNIFYNSGCIEPDPVDYGDYSDKQMCVNIIFDINGSGSPNQVGKDIGFVSIIGPKTTNVVGFSPDITDYTEGSTTTWTWDTAMVKCKSKGADWYLPNKDEANSLYVNKNIIGNLAASTWYWSSTEYIPDPRNIWTENTFDGIQRVYSKSSNGQVRCVRR